NDFTKADLQPIESLPLLDQYMMALLSDVNSKVQKAYKEYRFADVTSLLTNLMTNVFSAYYLDYTKDILYIEKQNDVRRRQVQSVLYYAVDVLVRLWAPILVHTAEEVNDFFHTESESIHLGRFPEVTTINNADHIKEDVTRLLAIRTDIFKALEEARASKVIGKSLEAHVLVHVSDDDRKLIETYCGTKFNQWLIVSKVSFSIDELTKYDTIEVSIEKCEGKVCPRCWNITNSSAEDGLCERCASVLK
ncbi:MAG: class I tRNA ligase family protein, partial [Longicatena sp.]